MRTNTLLVRAGQDPDPLTGAVVPPPCLTSTFFQRDPGNAPYEYSRTDNPSYRALEQALTGIEAGATDAVVFSSGTAAIHAVIHLLKQGDHILCDNNTYSGTRRIFEQCYRQFGIRITFCDATDDRSFENAIERETKLLWVECPSNPLLKICDIQRVAKMANKRGIFFCVDGTFATPLLQSPLTLGASLVLYSTTKYIAGHSDVIGGAITTNSATLSKALRWKRNALGLNPSPFDCWLVQRGLKTLDVRMRRHEENALCIAKWLQDLPMVERVLYPLLETHPQYLLASQQLRGGSGIVSAIFNLSREQLTSFVKQLRLWILAESLGGVESLIDYPLLMTQSGLTDEQRSQSNLPNGLLRFSVGIEDAEDLIADIRQALSFVYP